MVGLERHSPPSFQTLCQQLVKTYSAIKKLFEHITALIRAIKQ